MENVIVQLHMFTRLKMSLSVLPSVGLFVSREWMDLVIICICVMNDPAVNIQTGI